MRRRKDDAQAKRVRSHAGKWNMDGGKNKQKYKNKAQHQIK